MFIELPVISARPRGLLLGLMLLAGPAASGDVSSELLDIAARIEYGFFTEDDRAIRAARDGLQQLGRPTPWSNYYDALGAYRLAQLSWSSGRKGAGRWLDQCAQSSAAAEKLDRRFTEARILRAACALLAARAEPVMGMMQQRRAAKILTALDDEAPDNPRLALLRALAVNPRPGLEVEAAMQVRGELNRALEGFRQFSGELGQPDWGEAETLAHLGESYLMAGDQRRGRDLIEEALILAPDYRFAQKLMNKVSSGY